MSDSAREPSRERAGAAAAAAAAASAASAASSSAMHDDDEKKHVGSDVDADAEGDGGEDEGPEARRIIEEYKIWKKNTPFLYDCVVSHALEWPSLTVQWLPDRATPEGKEYTVQRLLLGTHTSPVEGAAGASAGASATAASSAAAQAVPQNYLLIAEVRLPRSDGVVVRKGGAGSAADDVDEGAYGLASGRLDIVQRIPHNGTVNRARYSPHNPDLIATKSPFKSVCVFDRSKHASRPPTDGPIVARPDLLLEGHTEEGYGLQWNPHAGDKGCIISGSNDGLVCMWNVDQAVRDRKKAGAAAAPPSLPPLQVFRAHTDVVEDVAWSHFQSRVFASCGDDSRLLLWDTRKQGDGVVLLWDLRSMSAPLHGLRAHSLEHAPATPLQYYNLQWSPFSADLLLATDASRRSYIWDVSRIGADVDEQLGSMASGGEEGDADWDSHDSAPAELLFVHGGHTDRVGDACWNPNEHEEWMVASVADDNIVQLWQVAESVYGADSDDAAAVAQGGEATAAPQWMHAPHTHTPDAQILKTAQRAPTHPSTTPAAAAAASSPAAAASTASDMQM